MIDSSKEKKCKVLVTGGLGFIGSHLVEYLVDSGSYEVTVIDNIISESSSREHMHDDVNYWIDDVRNLNFSKYSKESFDIVFHLAALARIQPSFEDPLTYMSVDAMGTSHVLEFARQCGAKLVYAGSSSAYGGPMLNPYAFAKYTGEQICELYSSVYDVSTVIGRFFNVYGPRQPTAGDYATVVGIFERQTRDHDPLTITGDGTQRRDFTHVMDIVRGLVALSQGDWRGEVFQLGTGVNYSINDLAEMFGGKAEYIPARAGETHSTLADISETTRRTDWKPHESLSDYVDEWKNNAKESL